MENFKKGGLDKATAQRVLDVWKETGATDDQGLKKLFLKRCCFLNVHIQYQGCLRHAGGACWQLVPPAATVTYRRTAHCHLSP